MATVQLEGLGQLKNSMTSPGIKTATFRLVAPRGPLRTLFFRILDDGQRAKTQ
jgi:hypothetical protein